MNEHVRSVSRRMTARQIASLNTKESDTANGVMYAEVTNVSDPENKGRIKVRLEYMPEDTESDWITPKGGFQYAGFGSTFDFPMVKDKVRIEYIGGNVSNMAWSPSWFHDSENSNMTTSDETPAPLGFDDVGEYDATRQKRRNILRTFSNWVLDMIEGTDIMPRWHLFIQSPTKRDHIKWFVPGSEETSRPYSVWHFMIDDYLRFWDKLNDGKSEFFWDSLNKKIYMHMHPQGNLKIEDHNNGSFEWDEKSGKMNWEMSDAGRAFFNINDNAGGHWNYINTGTIDIQLKQSHSISADEEISEKAGRNITMTAGRNIVETAESAITSTAGGNIVESSEANIIQNAAKSINTQAGISVTMTAPTISINGGIALNLAAGTVTITGTTINLAGEVTINGMPLPITPAAISAIATTAAIAAVKESLGGG